MKKYFKKCVTFVVIGFVSFASIKAKADVVVIYECGSPGTKCTTLIKTIKKCIDFIAPEPIVVDCINLNIEPPPPIPPYPIELLRSGMLSVHVDRTNNYQIAVTNLKKQIVRYYNLHDTIVQKDEFAVQATVSADSQFVHINVYNTWDLPFTSAGNKTGDPTLFHITLNINEDPDKQEYGQLMLSPNPFHQTAVLTLPDELQKEDRVSYLKIYSIDGRLLRTTLLNHIEPKIERGDLPEGFYIYELVNNHQDIIFKGKFIVEDN